MGRPLIGLLTDFGTRDYFVASLKGVILSINPEASIIDLTHDIPDYNLLAASVVLWACYKFFPTGTIFLGVVDPQVGTERRIILARSDKYSFIAPDNGLLTFVLNEEEVELYEIINKKYFLINHNSTFEARDKMAPACAWLSLGLPVNELGWPVSSVKMLDIQTPRIKNEEIEGQIIYQDKFGNLFTNINQRLIAEFLHRNSGGNLVLMAGKRKITEMVSSYAQTSGDKPFFLLNSLGLLEIALYQGSAASRLGLAPGDMIVLKKE
ncbi:MAG: SAM-dependent chlorinase/fluorinase [Candidatus Aminicenantes bacterium]|nr:SAM-dependent chlorinase/fluorinase [Candidatus Aminicenantes bacterium]